MTHLTAFVQKDLITLDVLQDVVADEALFKEVVGEIGLTTGQRLKVKKAILDAVDAEKLRLEAERKGVLAQEQEEAAAAAAAEAVAAAAAVAAEAEAKTRREAAAVEAAKAETVR